MGVWSECLVRLLLMALLLCASAYCSGTETALFSLTNRQVKKLGASGHRLERLVAHLLLRPSELLGALLLGNLIVNTLFFATSSVLMLRVEHQLGVSAAAAVALLTLLCLVVFGEVLPKSLSYAHPERFSVWVALPTVVVVRVLAPLVTVFRFLVVEPMLRLLLGPERCQQTVTGDEFKALIEAAHERGLINEQQERLFTEVVTFNLLRVRHVMRPRVDMITCAVDETPQAAQQLMMDHCATTVFVHDGDIDNIQGAADLRELILTPTAPLRECLRPVQFVPEQMTVEDLLQFFRKMRLHSAVVVDEYGGVAGSVSVEDVAEELFGPLQFHDAQAPVQQLDSGQYRISGSLPIHDWIKTFGLRPEHTGVSTVGGWVTALLGRIPRVNDVARWNHFTFTVESMQRHRVESVILVLRKNDE